MHRKSLGPFRPVSGVRPAGLKVQARPGPRAARPVTISSSILEKNELKIRNLHEFALISMGERSRETDLRTSKQSFFNSSIEYALQQ